MLRRRVSLSFVVAAVTFGTLQNERVQMRFAASDSVPSTIRQCVNDASQVLPHQAILDNFIHTNPLQHFQYMPFKAAKEHVFELESHTTPGERVFSLLGVDPRKRVSEAIVDLAQAFLDRGAAHWSAPMRERGFLHFFASLEGLGWAWWRRRARGTAERALLLLEQHGYDNTVAAEIILQENLDFLGIAEEERTNVLRVLLLEIKGWAGMFHHMQHTPVEAPHGTLVRLIDFVAVLSTLEVSSCASLSPVENASFGKWLATAPSKGDPDQRRTPHANESSLAITDQLAKNRPENEEKYASALLTAIGADPLPPLSSDLPRPKLQVYTCIDDRVCSFRRHVEAIGGDTTETFGIAGFFGFPMRFKPVDYAEELILAPAGLDPPFRVEENDSSLDPQKTSTYKRRNQLLQRFHLHWERLSFTTVGALLLSATCIPCTLFRLYLVGCAPTLERTWKQRITAFLMPKPVTHFDLPMSASVAAGVIARILQDMGTQARYAPVILVLGHCSNSVNNPFDAAHNCGACSGKSGGPNAKMFALAANSAAVRECLKAEHNIHIPDDTWFVGGCHDTTAETVEYYDTHLIPRALRDEFTSVQNLVERVCDNNAFERCYRFILAKPRNPKEARVHVHTRSTDLGEARPELGHATNASIVIASRSLTRGKHLDRRAFLPSYDHFSDDSRGTNLEHVLAPALIVCSGISLEYLFSTTQTRYFGAGTKVPLNVVGLHSVMQGTTSDLRVGLPTQMTEMHTPVRAVYVIESSIARVEAVLSRRKELHDIVYNDWVIFYVRDPITGTFFKQANGSFVPVVVPKEGKNHVPFDLQRQHGDAVARKETFIFWVAALGMVLSAVVPILSFGTSTMAPHGALVAAGATVLSLPVLAFSRRYLHGEFMFGRFATLSVGLVLGFNMVATAPTLIVATAGWGFFGFASAFLIGAYSDRRTAKINAIFAFAVYRTSDLAMIVACAFAGTEHSAIAAVGLLIAALFKSSQLPLCRLFARSMEGATPTSALGYAGLSAHLGVILLSGTLPIWYPFGWARMAVAGVGIATAIHATVISKIRAERKGALAYATSATVGGIFVVLALGYTKVALLLCFGHTSLRMLQVLRSPNVILDFHKMRAALGPEAESKQIQPWFYRLAWRLQRFDSDFHLINVLHITTRNLRVSSKVFFTPAQQMLITVIVVILAGLPFTPLSHFFEEMLLTMLPQNPVLAGVIMLLDFIASVFLFRFLFINILNPNRFHPRYFVNRLMSTRK